MTRDELATEFINALWNQPGIGWNEALDEVTRDPAERRLIRYDIADRLLTEGRISIVRFTSYAPSLTTTFMLFATEHGRIEIVDNEPIDWAGHQIGHIHDPFGKWDELMDRYSD